MTKRDEQKPKAVSEVGNRKIAKARARLTSAVDSAIVPSIPPEGSTRSQRSGVLELLQILSPHIDDEVSTALFADLDSLWTGVDGFPMDVPSELREFLWSEDAQKKVEELIRAEGQREVEAQDIKGWEVPLPEVPPETERLLVLYAGIKNLGDYLVKRAGEHRGLNTDDALFMQKIQNLRVLISLVNRIPDVNAGLTQTAPHEPDFHLNIAASEVAMPQPDLLNEDELSSNAEPVFSQEAQFAVAYPGCPP